MILAAAIKFHVDSTDADVVLCGARHGDVFAQLKYLGFEAKQGYTELEQGFIDHNNNFLTREEAFQHAKDCGQISQRIAHMRDGGECAGGLKMISEDLW